MTDYPDDGPGNRERAKARVAALLANRKPPKPDQAAREKRMEEADLDEFQEPDDA